MDTRYYLVLFVTGLLTSLGHCVGMCGGIIVAYAMQQRQGRPGRPWQLSGPFVRYHAGRLTGYAILGAGFALLGSLAAQVIGPVADVQAWIALLAGGLMVVLGLGLVGVLPTRRWVEGIGLGHWVTNTMRRLLAARSWRGQFGLGLANGFLPCGPVYAVAVSATALAGPALNVQSVLPGVLAMLAFGLGTVPALLVLGYGASTLNVRLRGRLFRLAAVLVTLVGVQLMLRGLAALGVAPHLVIGPVMVW